MRKTILIILFAAGIVSVRAQRSADYGLSLGFASCLTDINQTDVFYNPEPALQIFYRYNFNPRQAVRANILGTTASGSDLDFNNTLQQQRAHSFSGLLTELGITYEYNFFPYSTLRSRYVDYTPYIAGGLALTMATTTGFSAFPSIPFSAGFKINVANHIGLEFEYGFRKTFYDNFDGLTDMIDPDDQTWTHNNDWYSFMGVTVTWKMYNKLVGCPAFADYAEDKKRKK